MWCVVARADELGWSTRSVESAAAMLVDGASARVVRRQESVDAVARF